MSYASQSSICLLAISAATLVLWAAPVRAQEEVEPWRSPTTDGVIKPRNATSDLSATKPVATPSERREAHALTTAIFAKPGAAARAAEKVDAANQPDLSLTPPRPEWTEDKGLAAGGRGVEIKTPF